MLTTTLPWLAGQPQVWQLLLMAVVVVAAAVAQGIGGVGFAMLAAPVAALFFPPLAPGPLLTLGGFISLLGAIREYPAIDWRAVGHTLVGRCIGTLFAVYAMSHYAPDLLAVLFALSILAGVAISVAGLRLRYSPRNLCGAGLASGIMGTLTSIGAPPLALIMQHEAPPRLRATIGVILFLGASFSLGMLNLAGHYGLPQFLLSLCLLPCLLLGFAVSGRLKSWLAPRTVRRVLLALCAGGALVVLGQVALRG